jgi:hypothetical protein
VVDYDPLYVAARSVLLDALHALGPQRDAVIVVGAQAVYLRTGDADIAVSPYTTDADLVLAPNLLTDEPHIEELMRAARFSQEGQPGSWIKRVAVGGRTVNIPVDLMVPEGLAPPGGSRGARIEPHDKMAARKALGLEGAVIDNDLRDIAAIDTQDSRSFVVRVAGPAALMVAKLHKLNDRLIAGRVDRIADKDAADVYRIMQAVPVDEFMSRLSPLLIDSRAEPVSTAAVGLLSELFGAPASRGVQMAVEALRVAIPPARVEAVCTSFARQVRIVLAGS